MRSLLLAFSTCPFSDSSLNYSIMNICPFQYDVQLQSMLLSPMSSLDSSPCRPRFASSSVHSCAPCSSFLCYATIARSPKDLLYSPHNILCIGLPAGYSSTVIMNRNDALPCLKPPYIPDPTTTPPFGLCQTSILKVNMNMLLGIVSHPFSRS